MNVATVVTAALPIPVTGLHLIPVYSFMAGTLSVFTSVFCFLTLSFIFSNRQPIARMFFGLYGSRSPAVLPGNNFLRHIVTKAALIPVPPDWRDQLRTSVHNQGLSIKPGKVGAGLRFNNESELRIAKALDQMGVLFFPLCKGRLGTADNRQNREPDLLICSNGKWGILEVDGDMSHPTSRTYKIMSEIDFSKHMAYV
jgi:hypothetical protein